MRWMLSLLLLIAACSSPTLVVEVGFTVPSDPTQQIKQLRLNINGVDGTSLLTDELLPAAQDKSLSPPIELSVTLRGVIPGVPIIVLAEGLVGEQVTARALVEIPAVKDSARLAIFLEPTRCGDGVTDPNEACDDGNNLNGDECEADCTVPACGNLIRDLGEECDDGNNNNNDGCDIDCKIDLAPSCGDDAIVFPEECDDGVLNSDTTPNACRTDCLLPRCSDGVTDANEQCDDGPANSLVGACLPNCQPSGCGDGVFQPSFGEACDDSNNLDGDGCDLLCQIEPPPGCGDDAIVFPEECDDGVLNSDTTPNACRTDCLLPRCSDGVTDANEQCDDGGTNALLGPCLPDCSLARCGDGLFQPNRGEQCDDGNNTSNDGCDASCSLEIPPACGDGTLQVPEQCDSGLQNGNTPNSCRVCVQLPRCNDGIIDANEQCDDAAGNSLAGPCLLDCTFARCGDGVFDASRGEQCDDGNAFNLDGCSAFCEVEPPPSCGDGILNANEECDSAGSNSNNTPNACRLSCLSPRCGDDVIDNQESCDEGAANALAGPCLPDCSFARCGDAVFQPNRGEGCDDGNNLNGDGCDTLCQAEPPASCGDGDINNLNEQCDDGVLNSNLLADACRVNCTTARCGDATTDTLEACDDGGTNALLGPCLPDCSLARCGDGVFQPGRGEECDDSNNLNSDGCDSLCQFEFVSGCGNGVLASPEECDDGPLNSDSIANACRTNCTLPRCGDGGVDTNEGCDDGGANSLLGPCLPTCQAASCGDGIFQQNRGEQCDDGNNTSNDGCGPTCAFEVAAGCGDGVTQGSEQCDEGGNNSNTLADACRTNCTLPRCGDAVQDGPEQCDDGAVNSFAGPCLPTCQAARCGDGVLQLGRGELCDDGDLDPGDGCGATCLPEPPALCGDNTLQGQEECDNGSNNSDLIPNACRLSCVLARCSDGVIDSQEQCDNAGLNAFEGPCLPTCLLAACGDGILQLSRGEECDDSNAINDDGCSSLCELEASVACGNGIENNNEECDDANNANGDGCSAFCRYEPVQETENNDFFGNADGVFIPDVLISANADELAQDVFSFVLTSTALIRIELFDGSGPGACNDLSGGFDLSDQFSSFIDSDFGSGLNFCGRLELELPPGIYFVETFVSGFNDPSVPYTLELDATLLTCGDGLLDLALGEACDDGNRAINDGCNEQCARETCGDGLRQSTLNEECDDGDTISGNGCSSLCRVERCGDGSLQIALGEVCDDGNLANNDGCDQRCHTEICGNGFLQGAEVCDDGDLTSNDGCSAACQQEVVSLPYQESFDAGVSAFSSVSSASIVKWQIDGFRVKSPRKSLYLGNPLKRNYDDPGATIVASAFSPFFVAPATGAIVSFQLRKQTESGSVDQLTVFVVDTSGNRLQSILSLTNSSSVFEHFEALIPPALVGRTLRVEVFFDTVNSFGNTLEGVYLDDFRIAPFECGNAVLEFGEQCDDGNLTTGDGCSGQCLNEACGNGVIDFNEECDDNNLTNNDGCDATCLIESTGPCGNGIEEAPEQCDDGNPFSGDLCSSFCRYEVVVEAEPNDSTSTANGPFLPDVLIAAQGSNDFFAFTLPRPARVRIETFDSSGLGSCQVVETEIDLFKQNGAQFNFITFDQTSGVGDCSKLILDLAQGLYVVGTFEFSSASDYLLEIDADFETCGDGDLQAAEGEECDDSNTVSDDGCSSACLLERCGDGVLQPNLSEACDDGNTLNDDGCSSLCAKQEVSLPFQEAFDDGLADQFLIVTDGSSVLWQVDNTRAFSAPNALYFGDTQSQSYNNGSSQVQGEAQTPFFTVPGAGATLSFQMFQATEGGTTFFDVVEVSLLDGSQNSLAVLFTNSQTTSGAFVPVSIQIPASFAGQVVRVSLRFDSKDGFQNNFEGAYLDDLQIVSN